MDRLISKRYLLVLYCNLCSRDWGLELQLLSVWVFIVVLCLGLSPVFNGLFFPFSFYLDKIKSLSCYYLDKKTFLVAGSRFFLICFPLKGFWFNYLSAFSSKSFFLYFLISSYHLSMFGSTYLRMKS
uniref:Uncharacterized protein n=1 Tax=Nelumbo nucifera TaxID=4432 RepID=A0A822ZDD3_NELNU|nr:TPA_asm: hypothetical protein HUJ06_001362 [Nelumbo nucifera]